MEPDGWYQPGLPPREARSLIDLAVRALQAERDGDEEEALKALGSIIGMGRAAACTAAAYWCDEFIVHARGSGGGVRPIKLDIEVAVPDYNAPGMPADWQWAADLIAARAEHSRATWSWLVGELSSNDEWMAYIDTLLQFGVRILGRCDVEVDAAEVIALVPVVEMPHRWRDCRLGVEKISPVGRQVALAERVTGIVWEEISASDRKILHGYVCLDRRDRVSRKVMAEFERRIAEFQAGGRRAAEPRQIPTGNAGRDYDQQS